MPREIDWQKVQDLFREWKWQREERAKLDAKVSELSTAEREHYYDLIRRKDSWSTFDNKQR